MNKNISFQHYTITRKEREKKYLQSAVVLWFTGLSGAGKSTIANAVEQQLFEMGNNTYSLDGDNIRTGINQGLSFSEIDRSENLRRIAEVAKLFVDAGIIVLAAFISPSAKDRQMVKNIIGENDFIEIFVDTGLETCERRDVKGLYKKARAGEIKNFTGIDVPYENPQKPDIIVQTEKETISQITAKILSFVCNKIKKSE